MPGLAVRLLVLLILLQHRLNALVQLTGIVQGLLHLLPFLRLACGLSRLTQGTLRIAQLVGDFPLALVRIGIRIALEVLSLAFRPGGTPQGFSGGIQAFRGSVAAEFPCRGTKLIGGIGILLTVVIRQ